MATVEVQGEPEFTITLTLKEAIELQDELEHTGNPPDSDPLWEFFQELTRAVQPYR